MSKQIIKENGKPAFVVIPWKEWQRIESVLEDRADSEAVRAFLENPEESFPEDVVHALAIEREHPLKVFRSYRGLTQAALARAAGTSAVYLSQIERGRRSPGRKLLAKLARALDIDADLLTTA